MFKRVKKLDEIPIELFYSICARLGPRDLLALKRTCRKFDHLLDIAFWKRRLLSSCPTGSYPCLADESVDWIRVAIERERYLRAFGPTNASKPIFPVYTYEPIDALHIPPIAPNLILVGDRGRTLSIFAAQNEEKSKWSRIAKDSNLHCGWIWSIKSYDDTVISGSWDTTCRTWKVTPAGLTPMNSYCAMAQVLCTSFCGPNTVISSGNSLARVIDLRASPDEQPRQVFSNTGVVLCLECTNNTPESVGHLPNFPVATNDGDNPIMTNSGADNSPISYGYLFTGCCDGTLSMWDLRIADKPVQRIKLKKYPRKMSLLHNSQLWIAGHPNVIQLYDVRQGRFKLIQTTELPGYERGFGDLVVNDGAVFTAGLHGTVEAFHPTSPIIPMNSKPIAENLPRNPAAMAVHEDLLAVGTGEGAVHLWSTNSKQYI